MKINVDRRRCTGIGICESISPEHFEVGDDGALVLVTESFIEEERGVIEQAVRSCPAKALSIGSALAAPTRATAEKGET